MHEIVSDKKIKNFIILIIRSFHGEGRKATEESTTKVGKDKMDLKLPECLLIKCDIFLSYRSSFVN